MQIRLFAALSLPDALADRLLALRCNIPGAAWRPRENLHLTLAFYGEIDHATARDLDHELAQIAMPAFEISVGGVGYFGKSEPTALWAGVTPKSPELEILAQRCRRAARRVGLKPESRPYAPHVTLAYCKGTHISEAASFQQRFADFRSEPFWVEQFELYSSARTKAGSQYIAEAVYPLGAN